MTFEELRAREAEEKYPDQSEYDVTSQHCRRSFNAGVDWCIANIDKVPKIAKLIEAAEDKDTNAHSSTCAIFDEEYYGVANPCTCGTEKFLQALAEFRVEDKE
jgi:hypothetical protein